MENQITKQPLLTYMSTITQEKAPHKHSIIHLIQDISQKPYFEDAKHSLVLFKADCSDILSRIPDNSIDMIFADPPYFLSNGGITCHAGKMVSVNKGKWDESRGIEANHEFILGWLKNCQRILKPNGSIWVSGTSHVIHSVGFAMQQLGFKLLNDIVWFKINPPPNLSCRYFTHSTETIIWAAKNQQSRHIFNYGKMKAVNGKQMKNVWQDLLDSYINQLRKDIEDDSFWGITPPKAEEKVYGKHPTQKPIELLRRVVVASTNPGDIVLDPFSGSGTTGIAAIREGRLYIGIELEEDYLKVSVKRLKDEFNRKI